MCLAMSTQNRVHSKKYKPFPDDFDQFEKDDIPNNSDVVLILSHYLTALEKVRCDNIINDQWNGYCWIINGKTSEMKTDKPTIK